MKRIPTLLAALALVAPVALPAQQNAPPAPAKSAPVTAAAKIANAMSAAPSAIAAHATIMDWPSTPNGKPALLRTGTNGWVCYPKAPSKNVEANDPMCLDKTWQQWADAYMAKKKPQLSGLGIAYMLAPGGASGSGIDPFAEKATPGNDWGFDGPHMMIVSPDPSVYRGLPTKRTNGPYVMWAGSPWAHIMAPVANR